MTPAEVLRSAAALIQPKGAWTKGCYARDAKGAAVDPDDRDAVCFCARGAILRVGNALEPLCENATVALGEAMSGHGRSIVDWNDDPTRVQADVIDALLRAATLLEGGS